MEFTAVSILNAGYIYHTKKWVYLRSLLLRDPQPRYLGTQVNLDSRAEIPSKSINMNNNNNKNKVSFLSQASEIMLKLLNKESTSSFKQ